MQVHQREADTQSGKMVLRFREDKIRRLETLSKGLLSVDSYLADEKKMLMEELELMREKVDRNPELTRFAMENIRLLDEIRRYGPLECRWYLVKCNFVLTKVPSSFAAYALFSLAWHGN